MNQHLQDSVVIWDGAHVPRYLGNCRLLRSNDDYQSCRHWDAPEIFVKAERNWGKRNGSVLWDPNELLRLLLELRGFHRLCTPITILSRSPKATFYASKPLGTYLDMAGVRFHSMDVLDAPSTADRPAYSEDKRAALMMHERFWADTLRACFANYRLDAGPKVDAIHALRGRICQQVVSSSHAAVHQIVDEALVKLGDHYRFEDEEARYLGDEIKQQIIALLRGTQP
jgi:hypothetical protein